MKFQPPWFGRPEISLDRYDRYGRYDECGTHEVRRVRHSVVDPTLPQWWLLRTVGPQRPMLGPMLW